ncbi:inorganic phosphate transporter [Candidatus Gracilibacteria bacterium]|nr:inorganic phosphate transporter [Candidatus Gracilibacteria bacterium]
MEIFLLILCLIAVLSFEFVNGMNDTANAIAPVIYSHSLQPKKSVLIAAVLNFLGVLLGGTAVAMSILHLLPLGLIADQTTSFGVVLVLSILISAIIWDLGAWYLALPVSSSHALIGSILGVSLVVTNSSVGKDFAPHWGKAGEVIIGLLISPLIGFTFALFLIYIAHLILKKKEYFKAPFWSWDKPNLTMRMVLIGASGLVSFMHGKNDGQKGVGIATLILITLLPATFAINPNIEISKISEQVSSLSLKIEQINKGSLSNHDAEIAKKIQSDILELTQRINTSDIDKLSIRKNILSIRENYANIEVTDKKAIISQVNANENENQISLASIKNEIDSLSGATDYVPWWIILLVSISIGSGTMIGWKRIVETIGEKIGKYKMNYSQAASSALITAGTIGLASGYGLPVSTTHVMSSSVAGTMVEEHGWKNGIDPHMIRHIVLAWVLTMPVTILLAGSLFILLRFIFVT